MSRARRSIFRFLVSEDGPTAPEYAAMLCLITVGLIASISAFSSAMSSTFSTVSSTLGSSS
jgi:pilus assembly protein Flp/PilA